MQATHSKYDGENRRNEQIGWILSHFFENNSH